MIFQKFSISHKLLAISRSRAFTLIELVVTVGIFAIISTVIITRNSQFDEEIFLSDMAYDVALSVRRAQSYGINVHGSAGSFDHPYGIYFTNATTTYKFFVDTDDDGFYDDPDELIETYTLGRGTSIGPLCDPASKTPCDLENLTVIFRRPEPDAIIQQGTLSRAVVGINAPRGGQRYVYIESTGQFSIRHELEGEEDGKGDSGVDGDSGGILPGV